MLPFEYFYDTYGNMKLDSDMDILLELIGQEAFNRVVAVFQGDRIYFPKKITIDNRNTLIIEQNNAGTSVSALARRWGLSRRRVRQIIS